MPELPEVESARRLAHHHLAGKRIIRVTTVEDPIVYQGEDPRRFERVLRGRVVRGTGRKGKHLWLELDQPPWPGIHLGMSGSLHIYHRGDERPAYWKIELLMDDGVRLAMRNVRRLGRLRLYHDPQREPPICELGWDPLDDMPGIERFTDAVHRRKTSIKALLLDQGFLAGIGNWIADEVLYQARIAPARSCGSLSERELRAIHRCIRRVIRTAVEANADKDRFPSTWLFHTRWGKRCGARAPCGELLRFDIIAGRTSAWAPARQV